MPCGLGSGHLGHLVYRETQNPERYHAQKKQNTQTHVTNPVVLPFSSHCHCICFSAATLTPAFVPSFQMDASSSQDIVTAIERNTEAVKGLAETVNSMKSDVKSNTTAVADLGKTFAQNAVGELVDPNAPMNLQIAQAKTAYCKYLVVIQHLTTKKMEQKDADAKAKLEKAQAKFKRTKDTEDEEAVCKATENANNAAVKLAEQYAKEARSVKRVNRAQQESKPTKKEKAAPKAKGKAKGKGKAKAKGKGKASSEVQPEEASTMDEPMENAEAPTMEELRESAEAE